MPISMDPPVAKSRPRKFTIQSHFGQARQPRSRKNRPCDACRRRKTACVIPSEPPCLFCKSRGLNCRSSPNDDEMSPQLGDSGQLPTGEADGRVSPTSSLSPPPPAGPVTCLASPADTVCSSVMCTGDEPRAHPQPSTVVHQSLVRQPPEPDDEVDRRSSTATSILALSATTSTARYPVLTLEDNHNKTAHSMGLSAEQDTYLLDAFRCLILSENNEIDGNIIQVYPGSARPDDRPVHFLLLENENPDFTMQAKEAASDGAENLVWPYGEHLIRLYFRHVHPIYPVVTKRRFLTRYASAKMKLPASLRAAIYAMACPFWDRDVTLKRPCPFRQHQLVDHAHEALRREHENPNLFTLQACLLLHHIIAPEIDSVETPSLWTMTAQTTACAQTIGLHQDPGRWNIEPWEKSARKKLWWAVFSLDCWSSICHGNPPHIGGLTYTTTPAEMDDVQADEDLPEELQYLVEPDDAESRVALAARFLENMKIAIVLRKVLDCSFQTCPTSEPLAVREMELASLRDALKDWRPLLPHCLTLTPRRGLDAVSNCPLHLAFYASRVLLYRAIMSPATRAAKANPNSNLQKWFVTALQEFYDFTVFFGQITPEDLKGFWCRHTRSQLILCGNFLIYLFLLASEPRHIEAAYQLLGNFHQTIQNLNKTSHEPSRILIRPAKLRIDSFFLQAAQILVQSEKEETGGIPPMNPYTPSSVSFSAWHV